MLELCIKCKNNKNTTVKEPKSGLTRPFSLCSIRLYVCVIYTWIRTRICLSCGEHKNKTGKLNELYLCIRNTRKIFQNVHSQLQSRSFTQVSYTRVWLIHVWGNSFYVPTYTKSIARSFIFCMEHFCIQRSTKSVLRLDTNKRAFFMCTWAYVICCME